MLVDRYATHIYHRSKQKIMDRKEYKLVCIICLHIAAKTSGLYNLYMSELHQEEADTKEEPLPLSCYNLIQQDS